MTAIEFYNLTCSNRAKMQMIAQIMNDYLSDETVIDDLLNNRENEPTEEQIEDELYVQDHLDKIIELL